MRALTRSALLLALVLLATTAQAGQGVNLRWDRCLGDAGVFNKSFACNTNSGSEVLVCSFELGEDMADVSGQEIVITLVTGGATLPAWWAFKNAGTCRQFALSMNTAVSPAAVNCTDWAEGGGVGGIGAYNIGVRGPNSARLLAVSAVPPEALKSLTAGTEYFSMNFPITHIKTVGTGACDGCTVGACIVFNAVNITTPVLANNRTLNYATNGTDSFFATWQGGTISDYLGVHLPCPYPLPTKRSTWGALRALYR